MSMQREAPAIAITYNQIDVGDSYTAREVIGASAVERCAGVISGTSWGDGMPKAMEVDARKNSWSANVRQVLLLGLISKIIGRDFPGEGSVAVGIACEFRHAVPMDAELRFEIEVKEKFEDRAHTMVGIEVHLKECLVAKGTATIIPPA